MKLFFSVEELDYQSIVILKTTSRLTTATHISLFDNNHEKERNHSEHTQKDEVKYPIALFDDKVVFAKCNQS
jgi:hypothetical protein